MSTAVPKTASYELKSRNVAYRERRTHSIQPSTGSGTYAGTTGRSEIKFNLPASHLIEPRGCYLRFKTKLQVTATGALQGTTRAFLDGSAASVIRELEIKNGNGDILERVENVDQLALFNCRAKSESWRYNQGRQLMGFLPVSDEFYTPTTATLDTDGPAVFNVGGKGAGAHSKTVEWCIPMCMLSGLFSSDKVLPLKYMNRSGGPAMTVEIKLHQSAYAMTVADFVAAPAADANVDNTATYYEIQAPELVIEELVPTAVYDQALAQSIAEAGSDGLKLFYRANSGYNLATGANSGSEFTINIPLYEFSISHMVAWWRPGTATTGSLASQNVSVWQSGGVTRAQSSFGSYTMPTSGIEFDNPTGTANDDFKNNARGQMELSKVIGKVCGEGSSGFRLYDSTNTTAVTDDAKHRVYAFNYDVIDNMLQDASSQISGVDNRSSSLPAVVRFQKESGAPYAGNYNVQVYICADRLLSVTADRGAVSGVTA